MIILLVFTESNNIPERREKWETKNWFNSSAIKRGRFFITKLV